MRRRAKREYYKSKLNTGRIAGHGIAEGDYSEDSGPGRFYRRPNPVLIASREKVIRERYGHGPVIIVEVEDDR